MNAPNRRIRAHDALKVTLPGLKHRLEADRRTFHINWKRWTIFALICGSWVNAILLLIAER